MTPGVDVQSKIASDAIMLSTVDCIGNAIFQCFKQEGPSGPQPLKTKEGHLKS